MDSPPSQMRLQYANTSVIGEHPAISYILEPLEMRIPIYLDRSLQRQYKRRGSSVQQYGKLGGGNYRQLFFRVYFYR